MESDTVNEALNGFRAGIEYNLEARADKDAVYLALADLLDAVGQATAAKRVRGWATA
jgi:hypothetical protein